MKKFFLVGLSCILLVFVTPTAYGAALEWELDKAHSNIYFGIDHIYSKIQGRFNEFNSKIKFDPENLKESRFLFEIKVDSINTNDGKRDMHLLSADFFDAGKYPQITFESRTITNAGGGVYKVEGKLNIKGKIYYITLPITLAGIKDHPAMEGKKVAGFNSKIGVDRLALGVGDGKFYKMGMVGKNVEIFVSLEALNDK